MYSLNRRLGRFDKFLNSIFGGFVALILYLGIVLTVLWYGIVKMPLAEKSVGTGQVVVYDASGNVLTNVPEKIRTDRAWVP